MRLRLLLRPFVLLTGLGALALFLLWLPLTGQFTGHLYPRFQEVKASPYRLGQALAPLPRGIALEVCKRFSADGPWCLQGYFKAKLKGPPQGDPLAPCQGLSPPFLWSCAAVQGARFYELSNPFGACARFMGEEGAYLSCADFVGREAFARAGFDGPRGAGEICAKGEGKAQIYCRMGAAKEAIAKYRAAKLGKPSSFAAPRTPFAPRGSWRPYGMPFPERKPS